MTRSLLDLASFWPSSYDAVSYASVGGHPRSLRVHGRFSGALSKTVLDGYTSVMDSVRFGRSLGFGARSAAKALAAAADAATAPNPKSKTIRAIQTSQSKRAPVLSTPISAEGKQETSDTVATAARAAAHATVKARQTGKGVLRGSRRFGEAVWGPLAKVSGVLWLEITGSFFGIFALFAAQAAWNHRADLRSNGLNHEAHIHVFVFLGMAVLFGYFCISSFVRAYRR